MSPASREGQPSHCLCLKRRPASGQVPADSRYPAPAGILNQVSGTNQHYQPAALIGSIGSPAPSGEAPRSQGGGTPEGDRSSG